MQIRNPCAIVYTPSYNAQALTNITPYYFLIIMSSSIMMLFLLNKVAVIWFENKNIILMLSVGSAVV